MDAKRRQLERAENEVKLALDGQAQWREKLAHQHTELESTKVNMLHLSLCRTI